MNDDNWWPALTDKEETMHPWGTFFPSSFPSLRPFFLLLILALTAFSRRFPQDWLGVEGILCYPMSCTYVYIFHAIPRTQIPRWDMWACGHGACMGMGGMMMMMMMMLYGVSKHANTWTYDVSLMIFFRRSTLINWRWRLCVRGIIERVLFFFFFFQKKIAQSLRIRIFGSCHIMSCYPLMSSTHVILVIHVIHQYIQPNLLMNNLPLDPPFPSDPTEYKTAYLTYLTLPYAMYLSNAIKTSQRLLNTFD